MLAGVAGEAVSTPAQAAEALARARARQDCGLLIVTEQVCAGLEEALEPLRTGAGLPLVVEIPGPAGPQATTGGGRLRRLVRSVAGAELEGAP